MASVGFMPAGPRFAATGVVILLLVLVLSIAVLVLVLVLLLDSF